MLRGLTYGFALGVGSMFFLDPERGPERRARIVDASKRVMDEAQRTLQSATRELEGGAELSEEAIVERARAKLARVTSHADAIQVRLKEGNELELKGPVLASEHDRIVRAASRIPGVSSIDDDLVVHSEADGVVGLEGDEGQRSSKGMGAMGLSTPGSKVLVGATIAAILPLVPMLLKAIVFAAMRGVMREAAPQVMRKVSESVGTHARSGGEDVASRPRDRSMAEASANPT
jgi:hypothetical protein